MMIGTCRALGQGVILLQSLLVYTPFLQKVSGTASLDGIGLLISSVSGSLIFIVKNI